MQCPDCGAQMIRKSRNLQLVDRDLGVYGLDTAAFEECPDCGARFFDPETAEDLSRARAQVREVLLRSQAIAKFISSEEAAAILGTSRQNLGKRRRLLYSVRIGKTNVYLRRSVELLRECGDGRFPLVGQTAAVGSDLHF
jgi:predicted RNA-binding Zn-ribbon protein involved in translation (DUF1610 family)